MRRKVNRVGQNTLTVSLPAKWVKTQGLNAGDEIELLEDGSNLVLVRERYTRKVKKARLNLDGFNKMMLARYFHEFYRQGVEVIELRYTEQTISNLKKGTEEDLVKVVKYLLSRFIGMEIISHKSQKMIINCLFSSPEISKMDSILMRIFYLIKEFMEEFINSLDGGFKEFYPKIYDYHDNITKFTYYYLRLLNLSDISLEKKCRISPENLTLR